MAASNYFDTIQKVYTAFYQRPADPAGLYYWAQRVDLAGGDMTSVINAFATSDEVGRLYGTIDTTTIGSVIDEVYLALFNRAPDEAGKKFYVDGFTAGTFTPGTIVLNILDGARNDDAVAIQNKLEAANLFTKTLDPEQDGIGPFTATYKDAADETAARDWLAGVTSDPLTRKTQTQVTAEIQANIANAGDPILGQASGQTFALTTGVDTVAGTSGNDTINGNPAAAASGTTFNALDNIDGGAGTDTLNVTDTSAAAFDLSTAATVKNVEVLNVVTTSDGGVDTLTADVSNWTGLTTANFTIAGTDANMTITTKGNVTAATINGSVVAGITDSATTDTLASVTATDATGLVTVTSDKLTTLVLNNSDAGATVSAAPGTRALALTLNGVDGGTVADATATSLAITASGTKSTAGTVVAGAATSVSIAADEALTLTALTIGAATGLTVTGDSLLTLNAATLTALTSIDASAQTAGGVDTDAFELGTGVTFTGGAGNDSIQVDATTKAITMGAANDRVLLKDNVAALGTGGSIDAGNGTDTIAVSADEATTISTAGTFDASISNFEEVELAVAGSAAVTVDMSDFDDASKFKASVDVAQTIAVNNMASGGTVAYTATQTAVTTVSVTNALAGSADSLNISLAGSAAATNAGITVADVETLAIATSDTDADTTDTDIAFTITTLTAAAAKSVTVTGDAGLTLGTFSATTVTSFDASGMTTKASDGGVSWTTGALAAAATITGSGGDDTFVVSAATKAVTVNGGAGDDTITAANAQANVINAGDGNDTVTMGSGNVTIDLGAGNDTLAVGSIATQTSSITLGAGVDTVDINAVQGSAGAYLSLKDFAVSDKIDVSDVGNGTIVGTTLGTKVTLGSASTFANYIDAIAAGDGSANSVDGWFQLGGNTYLVIDNSAAATFQDGADIVVEIVGTVDLTNTTQASGVYTLV